MAEFFEHLPRVMGFVLMIIGAITTLFAAALALLWLSGHVAFIQYLDEEEEDANP